MSKCYFFITVVERSRNRLKPLPNQFIGDKPVDTSYNVQSDKELRSSYPIGTIFGAYNLIEAKNYYVASQIFPIVSSAPIAERIPDDMLQEYKKYIGEHVSSDKDTANDEPSNSSKKNTFIRKLMSNTVYKKPSVKEDGFYVSGDNWFLLIRNILNQVNTMIIGPTGTGKTELVMYACKKIGIPCHVYDMGSMYDPIAGLLGVHRLQEGGVSVFDYAKFTKDVSEPGVILLDELSRAPVTTNNILFPCLDSRRMLPVEIAGGDDLRSVKVHRECCFIATANVGAEYTGTMSMDRALVGRFFPVELDYMDVSNEVLVLTRRYGISDMDARLVAGVAANIRDLYKKQELSCALSTRETLMAAELIADGWRPIKAMELVFLPLFEGTKFDGERGIVAKILMSH